MEKTNVEGSSQRSNIKIIAYTLSLLWVFSAIVLTTISPDLLSKFVILLNPTEYRINLQEWDKITHFLAYALGGIILFLLKRCHRWSWKKTLALAIFICLIGEAIQLPFPQRSALDPGDLLSNSLGCILGLILPIFAPQTYYENNHKRYSQSH